MEFTHVDQRTDEKFARLFPTAEQNILVKTAAAGAANAPDMVKGARDEDGFHYRLYESRIPAGFDADAAFGKFATPDAREAAMAERKVGQPAREVTARQTSATLDERYPEAVRYYPSDKFKVDGVAGADKATGREQFNSLAKAEGTKFQYMAAVRAFVHKEGPVEAFAAWQSPEARASWDEEGKKMAQTAEKSKERASDVIDSSKLHAEGNHFLADHRNGLQLPSKRHEAERDKVLGGMRKASNEDLSTVFSATEREFKALERRQYAIQIKAAQEISEAKGEKMDSASFNKLSESQRREAANYNELPREDFAKMVALKSGYFEVRKELQERGVVPSREEAIAKKSQVEAVEKPKAVGEKSTSLNPPAPDKAAEQKKQGRQSSKGASLAAQLAGSLNR